MQRLIRPVGYALCSLTLLQAAWGLALAPNLSNFSQTLGQSAAQSLPTDPALNPSGLGTPAPVGGGVQAVTLLDGQMATLSVSFTPGAEGGPSYPPMGKFSKLDPAYYPLQQGQGPLRLTVQTTKPNASLILRARSSAPLGQVALPLDRLEYRVNAGAWQRAMSEQIIALLPLDGKAVYTVEMRLRLTGEEPASTSQLLLSWTIQGP